MLRWLINGSYAMKARIYFITIILSVIVFNYCGLKKPTEFEGNGTLHVQVVDDEQIAVPYALVQLTSSLGIQGTIETTDSSGTFTFTNLASSEYIVSAWKDVDETICYLGSEKISVSSGQEISITAPVRLNTSGLKINEIYYAGPINNEFYFFDQFVELYNGGQDTVYLDGSIIIRGGNYVLAGHDTDNDGDLDYFYFDEVSGEEHRCFVYAFQLDGDPINGREYTVAPGEYAVVDGDAIDHRDIIPTSIDLSNAGYEFYNPYFFRDPNNPDIPDYLNIITGEYGKETTVDFMISVASDIILLVSGEDSEYWDGIDIDTIIDGIEYSSSKTHIHQLDERIDKGSAGIEPDRVMTKYSGMSIQRIRPGFDTNNSTVDFMILDHPTPGY